jgi:hypothetical protein
VDVEVRELHGGRATKLPGRGGVDGISFPRSIEGPGVRELCC